MELKFGPRLLPRDMTLLWWCIAGSVAAHALLLQILPAWQRLYETPPAPLTVELREPPPLPTPAPPDIIPPKPLPVEAKPVVKAPEKPVALKPAPVKPTPREERPVEQPRAPILTAPAEAPVTAATPVVPEQKPVPPPEPPRPPAAVVPPAPPAPVTPPRFEAAYLRNPAPDYPLAAKRRGESGTVLLRVMVTADGNPLSVAVLKTSGSASLDEAARKAVTGWKFVPGKEGDKPVQAEVHVPVVFNIRNE